MTDIEPGTILTGASGAEYEIGEPIGSFGGRGECDAHLFGGAASVNALTGECRCIVCARCGHHTGNSHQGHYWKACKVLSARFDAEHAGEHIPFAEAVQLTSRDEFHMCCPPPLGCELEPPEETPGD